jgi:hypothetical protein
MSPSIVATRANKKSPVPHFSSTGAAIPLPSAPRSQIQAAEQLDQLGIIQLDPVVRVKRLYDRKGATLQPLVLRGTKHPFRLCNRTEWQVTGALAELQ